MKILSFAFLLVIAGAYALPQQEIGTNDLFQAQEAAKFDLIQALQAKDLEPRESLLVTVIIRRVINEIRNTIRALGLDPLVIDSRQFIIYEIPFLVNVRALVESLEFTGASNIAINRLDFNVFATRISFDFSLPELALSVGNAELNANVFGQRYNGQLKGSLSIRQIRIAGQVTLRAGILGITIRSLSLDLSLGGITSDLSLVVLGNDFTNDLNTLLNDSIPNFMTTYRNEINKLLEDVVWSMLR